MGVDLLLRDHLLERKFDRAHLLKLMKGDLKLLLMKVVVLQRLLPRYFILISKTAPCQLGFYGMEEVKHLLYLFSRDRRNIHIHRRNLEARQNSKPCEFLEV